jgi:hypothetical protein
LADQLGLCVRAVAVEIGVQRFFERLHAKNGLVGVESRHAVRVDPMLVLRRE